MRKIWADKFTLNDKIILDKKEKSLSGISNTIERLVDEYVTVVKL